MLPVDRGGDQADEEEEEEEKEGADDADDRHGRRPQTRRCRTAHCCEGGNSGVGMLTWILQMPKKSNLDNPYKSGY